MQQRHCLAPSPQKGSALSWACEQEPCTYCGEKLTFEQIQALPGRPILVKYSQGRPGCELFYCTHCTYHHVKVIPAKHYFHWDQKGQWSKKGAPLNSETAEAFCQMLSGVIESDSYLGVIVL
jgi:hypothetical protein